LTFTRVRGQFDPIGFPFAQSWDPWVDWLTTHETTAERDKSRRDGFVPGALPCRGADCKLKHGDNIERASLREAYRSAVHVTHVSALVFDVEAPDDDAGQKRGVPEHELERVLKPLDGLSWCAYTSSSKPASDVEHRFRVVCRLSRNVKRDEWRTFWLASIHALQLEYVDVACKDASRYFVAPLKLASETHHWSHFERGGLLDVDAVLSRYVADVPERRRAAASKVANVSAGGAFSLDAIEQLPQLTDGRWCAVRTLAFGYGKWRAYQGQLNLVDTLSSGIVVFERALEQCDLSDRNPLDKLMRLAEACIEDGWRKRTGELAADAAKLQRLVEIGRKAVK
jgi:hypothetical protein